MKLPAEKFGIRVAAAAARSVSIALAFAIFAAALLGSAPVWSQSAAVLSLVAVTTDTTAEGGDDLELRIGLPLSPVGRRVEIELIGSGTAVRGTDYSLIAATPGLRIMLGDEVNSTITLVVESAPAELRLRLRPRADNRISQGDRRLNLRLSHYRVVPEIGGTTDLPPALDLTILDDELPTAQQIQMGGASFKDFACVLLNGASVRCWGDVTELDRPPANLGPVAQLAVGRTHSCALTVSGEVRCWGSDELGESSPPADLGPVTQLAGGRFHSCAVTVSGQVRCWGANFSAQSSPPDDLGPVAQLGLGDSHSCVLTVSGVVRCWGSNGDGRSTPPDDLGLAIQLAVGYLHACALTVSGEVHCWGNDSNSLSSPPDDLGPVEQLAGGRFHSCAVTISGQVRCWGSRASDRLSVPSLPPSGVKDIVAGWTSSCALLTAGSVRCWGGSLDSGVPEGLQPGDIVMSVLPQQLKVGQRAAIRFADLRETTGAFTARIEVFGEGAADVGRYYRLLDRDGMTPLVAEADGSYRLGMGDSPMAWLEALEGGQGQPLILYVLPLDPVPSLRRVAQPVELVNPEPFSGSLILRMHGGARQLLTAAGMAQVPLRLSLADSDGKPLNRLSVFTVRLQGMVSGDATVVPAGPFEITASDTVAGTAELMVIFGDSAETTLHFSVAEPSTGTVLISMPTALRVTRARPVLDVDEDDRVGTEDVIALIRFVGAGPDSPSSLEAGLQQRLESLFPEEEDVVDLRLDLNGDGLVEPTDVRFLLRYLAGLRGSALGEGVRQRQVEAVFQPNR